MFCYQYREYIVSFIENKTYCFDCYISFQNENIRENIQYYLKHLIISISTFLFIIESEFIEKISKLSHVMLFRFNKKNDFE